MAHAQVDSDARKRRRRKSRYYDAPQYEEDDADLSQQSNADAYQPPMDAAALREARLKAMDTPTTARQKMKNEHKFVRPAKSTAKLKPKSVRTSSILVRPRTSVVAVKTKTSTTKTPKTSTEDTYQYVYQGANPSMVDRRDFQQEHDSKAKDNKTTQAKRKSTVSTTEKPKVERRKTEPVLRRTPTTATVRPSIRKSTTSAKLEVTPEAGEEAQKEPEAETVVSAAKSTKTQRNSVFSSFFAKPAPAPERKVSCLVCGSDTVPVAQSAKLPCTHRMCHECLKRLFKLSVKDPAHMPPKCCNNTEIDLKHVDALFSEDFKKKWNRKLKEYRAKNRIYCPQKGCGEWIQPKHMYMDENRRKVGKCSKCRSKVCATCNMKAHKSRECPKDPAMKQFTEVAEQAGWRKCYNCSAMVELKEGCNHMTCRCTAEFCMVCGLKWKSCDCPWFSYNAVDDLRGDPVRYQEEMDRRQQQVREDERVAREMAGLNLGDRARNRNRDRDRNRNRDRNMPQDVAQFQVPNDVAQFQVRTPGGRRFNTNFFQQAREVLTADYQNAEVAARGLLGGWLAGRENSPMERSRDDLDLNMPQVPGAFPETPPRRRVQRVRRTGADRRRTGNE